MNVLRLISQLIGIETLRLTEWYALKRICSYELSNSQLMYIMVLPSTRLALGVNYTKLNIFINFEV